MRRIGLPTLYMTSFYTYLSRGLWLLLLVGWLASPAFSQEHILPALQQQVNLPQKRQLLTCDTPDLTPEQLKKFTSYIKQAEASGQQLRKAANGTTFIGIKPWRGTGNWTDDEIIQRINKLNIDFIKSGIQFYIVSSGIGIITAANSQTISYPADEASLLNQNFEATAINVFFANVIHYCAYPPCVTAEGLSPSLTDLVILGDRSVDIPNPNVQARKDDYILIGLVSAYNTLSQKMGNYFGLLNTDQGATAANCQDRERPIGNRAAGDTDRGDLVDDTDADPYLLYIVNNVTPPYNSTTCTYTGTLQYCDPAWPVRNFAPPTTNIMSPWGGGYMAFGNICSDLKQFSPHQLTRMQSFLAPRFNSANQYHLENGVPGVAASPVISVSLTDASTRITPLDLTITVNDLPGTLGYLLERATDANFISNLVAGKTSTGGRQTFRDYITSPSPNSTYYYRVRATNGKEYSNIAAYSCSPTATLSGSQTVSNGQSATYTVALTGTPPWDVRLGGQAYSNVTTSPLQIVTPPFQALQQTYTQTTSGGSVTNTCGTVPMSGTASVTVLGTCPAVSVTLAYGSIGCGATTASGSIFTSPSGYAAQWRNVTTSTDYPGAGTFASNLAAGDYTIVLTGPNGCPGPQQRFTIRDYGPNGSTATLSGPANNRIVKGQQTSIRVQLTGTAPWSVTYAGRGNRQYVANAIATSSYDIPVLPDSSTTYRLVAVSGQCSATALSGSATLIVVPALTGLEYFFDTDPGTGKATPIAVGFNQTNFDQTVAVPVPNLPAGVHTLLIRGKDGNGYWGGVTGQSFITFGKEPIDNVAITQVEYRFDGVDSPGTTVSVSATANQAITLPVALSQTPGLHVISTRVKDNRDRWSGFTDRPYIVFGTGSSSGTAVTQVEYYVDTDPGVGLATPIAYNPAPGAPLSLSLNAGSLSPGTHTLLVRAKDAANRWSISYVRLFVVILQANGISRIEYFFDDSNPVVGSGQPVAFSPPNSASVTAQGPVSITGLAPGAHTITVRAQAGGLVWSTTKAASFTVTPCTVPLATLNGSLTATTDQVTSFSVGLGGSAPFSVTANGQVQSNIQSNTAYFTIALTTPGTYTLTPQSLSLAVSNSCGSGQVSGQIVVTVVQGTNCTVMQTVKAGSWDDPTVWSCGRLPIATDAVLVRHAVSVAVGYTAYAKTISFDSSGRLNWGVSAKLLLGF
jgi:hypothetical protein